MNLELHRLCDSLEGLCDSLEGRMRRLRDLIDQGHKMTVNQCARSQAVVREVELVAADLDYDLGQLRPLANSIRNQQEWEEFFNQQRSTLRKRRA